MCVRVCVRGEGVGLWERVREREREREVSREEREREKRECVLSGDVENVPVTQMDDVTFS